MVLDVPTGLTVNISFYHGYHSILVASQWLKKYRYLVFLVRHEYTNLVLPRKAYNKGQYFFVVNVKKYRIPADSSIILK